MAEEGLGQEDGVAPVAVAGGLAGFGGVSGAEGEESPQSLRQQVRLISEHNRIASKRGLPTRPTGGALNGTEHAARGSWIIDAVLSREAEAVQLGLEGLVAGSANHGDLFRSQGLPLLDQMGEHGRAAPGQQQLGSSHARGPARGQDDHSDRKWTRSGRPCHTRPNAADFNPSCKHLRCW